MLAEVRSGVVALLIVAGLASAVAAPDKPWATGVSQTEQDQALVVYREGNAEFEESRYPQALAKYREALAHWDHPVIRFNMAVALINLDQPLEAYPNLEAAMKFGAAPLGADAYAQALTYKKLLDGQLTHLRVTSDVDGADVTLDGRPILHGRGEASRLLAPGPHQVVASKPTFVTETSTLVLVPGREIVHAVKLEKLIVKTHQVRRWRARTPWLVVGAGVGALAIGGILEVLAHGEYTTYDQLLASQCPVGCSPTRPPGMQQVDGATTTGRIENVAGVTLVGLGGAAAIAGLVGVFLNQPHTELDRIPAIAVAPGTAGGMTATATWAW